jgi:DNA replication ATP-dependent helicase Dna2
MSGGVLRFADPGDRIRCPYCKSKERIRPERFLNHLRSSHNFDRADEEVRRLVAKVRLLPGKTPEAQLSAILGQWESTRSDDRTQRARRLEVRPAPARVDGRSSAAATTPARLTPVIGARRVLGSSQPTPESTRMAKEVVIALEAELEKTSEPLRFVVTRVAREKTVYRLEIAPQNPGKEQTLDESLEGARAWWPGNPNGTARVLSVMPQSDQIAIHVVQGSAPQPDSQLRIYPPEYLESLRNIWNSSWAWTVLGWLDSVKRGTAVALPEVPSIPTLPHLRRAQRQAFGLLKHPVSFLWGPPGTGKTFTLGTLVAPFLIENPVCKVLVLSTTNSAVDEALLSVAAALDTAGLNDGRAKGLKQRCKRIGSHFIASKYDRADYKCLLPVRDETLFKELVELEAQRPEPSDVIAYQSWKERNEELRRRLGRPPDDNNVVAMTTTFAAYIFDVLKERAPFDLVVFDEASQVSVAYAAALGPLGARAVFAGDPQQLASIAKHDSKWLKHSMFEVTDTRTECFLDEQERMHEDICRIVSGVFYDGRLKPAAKCNGDTNWAMRRKIMPAAPAGSSRVYLHHMPSGTRAGHTRGESAEFIRDFVGNCLEHNEAKDILVLVPFRRQRYLIRSLLKEAGMSKVRVTTVHRAQGSECHTVIFDPVSGDSGFLTSEEIGRRLINVALSRAMARLVIVASPADLRNQWLRDIAKRISAVPKPTIIRPARPRVPHARDVVFQNGFPERWLNRVVRFGQPVDKIVGEIVRLTKDGFEVRDLDTFTVHTMRTEAVRNACRRTGDQKTDA